MRPIPARKHHWAAVVIVVVVVANTLVTFRRKHVTGEQANMLAEVLKRQDPALYGSDGVFSETGERAAWRLHLPGWQSVLSAALHIVGPAEPINALRLLGAVMLLLYMLSMYVLLYRQTHSTSVAVLVAVMSMAIFSTNRPYWGMGPVFAVTPQALYLSVTPLLVLAFVRLHRRPAVVGAFFAAGLCGNIDLVSAVNLTAVMFAALLLLGRLKGRAWARGAVSVSAAAVGAAPAIYHYCATFSRAGAAIPQMSWQAVRSVLKHGGLNVLYPEVLAEVLRWLPVACVLAVPAAIVLAWAGRYRASNLGEWLWLLAATALVALGLHGLVQLIAWWFGRMPPVIELFGALRLAMLPLYVLFAQAMVHVLRMADAHRAWVRAVAGLLAAVYIGSSYNTRPVRHMVLDLVADTAGQEQIRRHDARKARDAELREIASWAGRHTEKDALFLANRAEIRLFARRSLLSCPADLPYLLHLAPQRAADWDKTLRQQRRVLAPSESARADADLIVAFVDAWRRRLSPETSGGRPTAPTYVVISARSAPPPSRRLKELPSPNETWGQHWRLLQILPPTPVTRPTTTTTTNAGES